MKYRPDIDGLRSLAILPVLAYHAGVQAIPGGFVGVDVFFVISGYLIGGIIAAELAGVTFSLLDFYRRRVLRIVPILVVVLLATLAAGYLLLFPLELKRLGESAGYAALFSSNIYFWMTTNYFDTASDELPLLHTWSLAVEEQFYIFLPLVMIAIHRWMRTGYLPWIIVAVIASFALSAWGLFHARTATFYMLPTRAWELGAGVLLAVGGVPALGRRNLREAFAWAGAALVIVPMLVLTDEDPFPGWNALAPVIGASVLIYAAPGTSVGRLLSTRPAVYIGSISYALYLWHWPVITFDKILTGPGMSLLETVRVIAISFVLAAISKPLIERPFRFGLTSMRPFPVVASGVAALTVVTCLAAILVLDPHAYRQYPAAVTDIARYGDYEDSAEYIDQFRSGTCFIEDRNPPGTLFARDTCLALSQSKPNILVLGDSHAADFWRALQLEYPDYNFLQATDAGCRPLLTPVGPDDCVTFMRSMFQDFVPNNPLDGVIIAARWWYDETEDAIAAAHFLQSHVDKVLVVAPSVEYLARPPFILARAAAYGSPDDLNAARNLRRLEFARQMENDLDRAGLSFVSLINAQCPDGICRSFGSPGVPAHFDTSHMTLAGARLAARGLLDGWLANPPAGPDAAEMIDKKAATQGLPERHTARKQPGRGAS